MNKSLNPIGLAMLLTLAIMWGSSFTFIKIALDAIPPLTIAAGRILLAAVLLGLIAYLRHEQWPRRKRDWALLVVLGVIGNSLPFYLISWGQYEVDSSMTAVLMAFIPLITPIMAHFFTPDERLTPFMMMGVAIGFGGLVVLVGPSVLAGLGAQAVSQGAILIAAFSYASAALIARRLLHISPIVVAASSLSIASVLMVPLSVGIEHPWTLNVEWHHLAAVVYLGLFPTALANILLLKVIQTSGVSFLAMNNYLVPVFGVAFAAFTLGEQLPPEMLTALGIILFGIFVSNLKRNPR